MPLFFIHTLQAGLPRDVFGQNMPDLNAMYAMTLAYAGDLLKDADRISSVSELHVQVTNGNGQRVASVSISADAMPFALPPHLTMLDPKR